MGSNRSRRATYESRSALDDDLVAAGRLEHLQVVVIDEPLGGVPLPQIAIATLCARRARQSEERLLAGENWQDSGLVFTTLTGAPLDAWNVVRSYHAALLKAGLPRFRFHDLRHSCASLLLAQGVAPRTIMDMLGNSEIRLTMDTYAHVMPAMLDDAAAALDAALS